jgi:hypothetical protein
MSQVPFDPDQPDQYPDPEDIRRMEHQDVTAEEAMDEVTPEDGFTDESAYAPVDSPVPDVTLPEGSEH